MLSSSFSDKRQNAFFLKINLLAKWKHVEGIFIDKQKKTKKRVSTNSFYDFRIFCLFSCILLGFFCASTFFVWFVDPLMENFVSNRFLSLMNWFFFWVRSMEKFEGTQNKKRILFSHKKKVKNFEGIESGDVVTNFERIVMNCHLCFVWYFVREVLGWIQHF